VQGRHSAKAMHKLSFSTQTMKTEPVLQMTNVTVYDDCAELTVRGCVYRWLRCRFSSLAYNINKNKKIYKAHIVKH